MSESQLRRKLKTVVAQTPANFIRSLRLKRAANLLKEHADTVTDTAYRVGFNNLSYFARSFKEEFGVLPSEYGTCKDSRDVSEIRAEETLNYFYKFFCFEFQLPLSNIDSVFIRRNERSTMKGIQYVTDEDGNRTAVQIDLKEWGSLWEDLCDIIVAESRKGEETISWEDLKKEMADDQSTQNALHG